MLRVLGETPPGTFCICCHSAEGRVLKIKDASVIGGKPETLHRDCAERWFGAIEQSRTSTRSRYPGLSQDNWWRRHRSNAEK